MKQHKGSVPGVFDLSGDEIRKKRALKTCSDKTGCDGAKICVNLLSDDVGFVYSLLVLVTILQQVMFTV